MRACRYGSTGEFLIKHVIVCGDDFGMNADIDEGRFSLVALGRMSAVSCLTLGPTFLANAARLAKLDIDLGLHLNRPKRCRTARRPCRPCPA